MSGGLYGGPQFGGADFDANRAGGAGGTGGAAPGGTPGGAGGTGGVPGMSLPPGLVQTPGEPQPPGESPPPEVLPDPAGPVLGMEAEPWLPVRGISYWSPPDVTMGDHLVYGQWLPEPEPPHRGRTFLKITAIVAAAATAVVGVQALRGMFDIDPLSVPKLGGQVAAQGELPEGYSLLSDADLYPSHLVCGATTWELVGEASSVPPGGQEALAQAVELVEELSGVDLLEADSVSSRTKVGTPITIQFVPTDEVQDMAEGRSGDTVGVASTQRTIQGIVEADIYLDQDWFDLALRRQHDEAVLVIVHEFGHALGLGHAEDAQSVMYPQGSASTRLLSSDVEAFRAVLPDCG